MKIPGSFLTDGAQREFAVAKAVGHRKAGDRLLGLIRLRLDTIHFSKEQLEEILSILNKKLNKRIL